MAVVNTDSDYPYANTRAAQAMSEAIDRKSDEGTSLRQMAGRLGYKSAVVLSHMRTGRLPIPIDRAGDIAKMVGMEPAKFLILVLEQRYPDVDFKRAFKKGDEEDGDDVVSVGVGLIARDLATLAGKTIDKLPAEHIGVMRELVSDAHPRRRWAGVAEAGVVDIVRQERPDIARDGLTPAQAVVFREALTNIV